MPIDTKCYDLAEHFLNSDATEAMKTELAEWIQWHVELWLYDDKDGAKEAADQLGAADPELLRSATIAGRSAQLSDAEGAPTG